ncbi:class II chitin synthase [Histoplasma ohiense]|nr:class II chitin synthase [Histoplasma ohiense (nom. inval.)]
MSASFLMSGLSRRPPLFTISGKRSIKTQMSRELPGRLKLAKAKGGWVCLTRSSLLRISSIRCRISWINRSSLFSDILLCSQAL